MTTQTKPSLEETYGQSKLGNFKVIDKIGVPHPYCITPKHVEVAADRFGGMLGEDAIRAAEKAGAHCGTKLRIGYCQMPYDKHEQALLIECAIDAALPGGEAHPELHEYLLAIKDQAEKDGYAGFAFMKKE